MTAWIIKIGQKTPQHWSFARDDGFWDVREPGPFRKIEPGDDIFFWLSGHDKFAGWSRAKSALYPITTESADAHWIDNGPQYSHRLDIEVVSEESRSPVRWAELQDAAERNYAPPAPANPVNELEGIRFLQSLFGFSSDFDFVDEVHPIYTGEDLRSRQQRTIIVRQGQPVFRRQLFAAYQGRCAISGTTVADVLEAAHIDPYRGTHTNEVTNGLLLRSDLHTLFDLHRIAIDDGLRVWFHPGLQGTRYWNYNSVELRRTADSSSSPSLTALKRQRSRCEWLT